MSRVDLVLHIGLHKTATTYVQGVLDAHRADLLEEGLLYPTTGTTPQDVVRTRDGAQSGHALFTKPRRERPGLMAELLAEVPDSVSTVLMSSEDFTLRRTRPTPERLLARFAGFERVQVVLVLRRQDTWIESFYKQVVDQFRNYETRSLDEYVRQEGPSLLDYHARFAGWRDLVGPENFHVLSYDDLPDGLAIGRRLVEIAGVSGAVLEGPSVASAPRYHSLRGIDTLGMRILNGYRLEDRAARTRAARAIYDLAPDGDVELMSPATRQEIQRTYAPVNERIEAEWCTEPVPGLRFGSAPRGAGEPPSGPEVVEYVEQVISLCEDARRSLKQERATGRGKA